MILREILRSKGGILASYLCKYGFKHIEFEKSCVYFELMVNILFINISSIRILSQPKKLYTIIKYLLVSSNGVLS